MRDMVDRAKGKHRVAPMGPEEQALLAQQENGDVPPYFTKEQRKNFASLVLAQDELESSEVGLALISEIRKALSDDIERTLTYELNAIKELLKSADRETTVAFNFALSQLLSDTVDYNNNMKISPWVMLGVLASATGAVLTTGAAWMLGTGNSGDSNEKTEDTRSYLLVTSGALTVFSMGLGAWKYYKLDNPGKPLADAVRGFQVKMRGSIAQAKLQASLSESSATTAMLRHSEDGGPSDTPASSVANVERLKDSLENMQAKLSYITCSDAAEFSGIKQQAEDLVKSIGKSHLEIATGNTPTSRRLRSIKKDIREVLALTELATNKLADNPAQEPNRRNLAALGQAVKNAITCSKGFEDAQPSVTPAPVRRPVTPPPRG